MIKERKQERTVQRERRLNERKEEEKRREEKKNGKRIEMENHQTFFYLARPSTLTYNILSIIKLTPPNFWVEM